MSYLPQIIKLTLSKSSSEKDQENGSLQNISELSKKQLGQEGCSSTNEVQCNAIQIDNKKDDRCAQMRSSKQYFIMIHKRRLQVLYPNFRELEIEEEAAKIWDQLNAEDKIDVFDKYLEEQNSDERQEQYQRHQKTQNILKKTQTKNEADIEQKVINEQSSSSGLFSRSSQNENVELQPHGDNQQNDESNASTAIGQLSNSQGTVSIVTFTLVALAEAQKSESNEDEMQLQIIREEPVQQKQANNESSSNIQHQTDEIGEQNQSSRSNQHHCQSNST